MAGGCAGSVGAVALAGAGRRGELTLGESLDRYGRGRAPGGRIRTRFALAMIPLAAKYVARGALDDAAGMVGMLGGDPGGDLIGELRALIPTGADAVVAGRVGLTLEVAAALAAAT
ncbi:hypothetical protein R8Z50_17695 [Longispora sp. K20-0274]|uniref:hypothetical protein n=1 Tax=Longispora sp. K20-0274 TaxID=3088255 RepID=UPI00399C3EBB